MGTLKEMTRKSADMEEYLNRGIKDLIGEFPKLADLLNKYNIGCVPCNVGSCILKDIVEIHNLSIEEERELMVEIAKVIYPRHEVKIPLINKKPLSPINTKNGNVKNQSSPLQDEDSWR